MNIIYPTSSSPPTYGHADLINRVYDKFDKIYWVAAESYEKKAIFPKEVRLAMMQDYLDHYRWKNVFIEHTKGSIVRYAISKKTYLILRGIRNHGDFTSEFELATGNRSICNEIETFCILASPEYCSTSSSIARELLRLEEDTQKYILPSVAEKAKPYIVVP